MKNWLHDPVWFTPPDGSSRVLWKDAPSPPAAPDYAGAAQATASGNLENAKYATAANRVNQYSPYGSSIYTQGNPGSDTDPQWRQDINLSPTGASLLKSLNDSQLGIAGLQQGATDTVRNTINQPFDINSPQEATDRAYANITSRLDPQWDTRAAQEESKLRNQGIAPGSEAYTTAMRDFNNARNDAYTQANTTAMNFAPQTYQLGLAARNQPLNELNAIRTGSQVTNPQFGNVPQQGAVPGANMLGATQAQGQYDMNIYNQGVGQANAFNQGLFSLGSAFLGMK